MVKASRQTRADARQGQSQVFNQELDPIEPVLGNEEHRTVRTIRAIDRQRDPFAAVRHDNLLPCHAAPMMLARTRYRRSITRPARPDDCATAARLALSGSIDAVTYSAGVAVVAVVSAASPTRAATCGSRGASIRGGSRSSPSALTVSPAMLPERLLSANGCERSGQAL